LKGVEYYNRLGNRSVLNTNIIETGYSRGTIQLIDISWMYFGIDSGGKYDACCGLRKYVTCLSEEKKRFILDSDWISLCRYIYT